MADPTHVFSGDYQAVLDVKSKVNVKPVVKFRITIRAGAYPRMIEHTVLTYLAVCRALFDGELPTGEYFMQAPTAHGQEDSYVNIYNLTPVLVLQADGVTRKQKAINKCNEMTWARALCEQIYGSESVIVDAIGLMSATQSGEKPATLSPARLSGPTARELEDLPPYDDTPYPVPTIVERTIAQQKKVYDTRGLGAFDDDPDSFYDDVEKRTLQSW